MHVNFNNKLIRNIMRKKKIIKSRLNESHEQKRKQFYD